MILLERRFIQRHARLHQQGAVSGQAGLVARDVFRHVHGGRVQLTDDVACHLVARTACRVGQQFLLDVRQHLGHDGVVAEGLESAVIRPRADEVHLADVMADCGGVSRNLSGLILGDDRLEEIVAVTYHREVPATRIGHTPLSFLEISRAVSAGHHVVGVLVVVDGTGSVSAVGGEQAVILRDAVSAHLVGRLEVFARRHLVQRLHVQEVIARRRDTQSSGKHNCIQENIFQFHK